MYVNREISYSILLQGVCREDLRFTHVVLVGRVHAMMQEYSETVTVTYGKVVFSYVGMIIC